MQPDQFQQHESGQDRSNEADVIEAVLFAWECAWAQKVDRSRSYGLDYAVGAGNRIRAFVEVKCPRSVTKGFGDGFYIGLRKVMQARSIHDACGLPCLLVVRFTKGAPCWAPLDVPYNQVKWFGWNEPRDVRDLEPCAVIAWDRFNPLLQTPWS